MSPVGFEPIISAGELPQTDALDRAATGTGQAPFFLVVWNYSGTNIALSVQFITKTVQIIVS